MDLPRKVMISFLSRAQNKFGEDHPGNVCIILLTNTDTHKHTQTKITQQKKKHHLLTMQEILRDK